MVNDHSAKPLRQVPRRPGKRWGVGLASIVELLGTRPRRIEDDITMFAETQPLERETDTPGAANRPTFRKA